MFRFMPTRIAAAFVAGAFCLSGTAALAAPCMTVTLTGTQGGPPSFNGLAGSGTLVTYGDDADNCRAVALQFDTGRGTTQRLSEIGMPAGRLSAVFLTHMHSDHVEGLVDLLQLRWHFNSAGPQVDLVCSEDAVSPRGHVLSCRNYSAAIGDALIAAGEIAQRIAENPDRLAGGPADLVNLQTFEPGGAPAVVWSQGDVTVSAIASSHVPGHASYRVDTPAGSVVIGGDAGNTNPPPRDTSTSAAVELLAEGADVLVHSTIHPVMGPDGGTGFPPPIFFRQSTATDLGGLAARAGVGTLMLTHLIPSLGAPRQGPFQIPGGGLTEADFQQAVDESGFTGATVVGTDLASIRLPAS